MRFVPMAGLAAFSASLALSLPSPLHGAEHSRDDPAYSVAVERVEVDVLALDRNGNFVSDLTKADFEVTEEGNPVEIEEFDLRSLRAEPLPPSLAAGPAASLAAGTTDPLAAVDGRKFILFVDMLNCGAGKMKILKPALLKFVAEVLHPADELLIAILTWDRRVLVLQTFTSDRSKIVPAIQVLRGNPDNDTRQRRQEEELYSMLYPNLRASSDPSTEGGLAFVLLRIQTGTALVQNFAAEQNQRAIFSLNALASTLERVENAGWQTGRKSVVYVTEGLPLRPAQGLIDVVNKRIDEYNTMLSAASQNNPNLQNLRAFPIRGDYDLRDPLKTAIGRLNRVGATLYTLDARGIFHSAGEDAGRPRSNLNTAEQQMGFFENQETLQALAEDTGGLPFFNRTNFDTALRTIEQDNRERYFLTYQPPKHKKSKKAKFYEITVKCKRPGVELRARKGYLD
jgi:VWFA-related protein